MRVLVEIICMLVLVGRSMGWWDLGHMVIYEIARDNMEVNLVRRVDEIMEVIKADTPGYSYLDHASWPDDIIATGFNLLFPGHWKDGVFLDGITRNKANVPNDLGLNVVTLIESSIETIKYKVEDPHMDGMLEKSFMLHHLVHCVGDLHQPMHEISRYSKEHLSGDQGGNLFKLNIRQDDHGELHAYIDNIVDMFKDLQRPLDESSINYVKELSKQLQEQYPKGIFKRELDIRDFNLMSEEVYKYGEQMYEGLKEGDIPSNKYIASVYPILTRLIVLAGYRLSIVLTDVIQVYINNQTT